MKFEIINLDTFKGTGKYINLITLDTLRNLPENTKLISIFGESLLSQDANEDTRGGYVSYGLANSLEVTN